MNFSSRPHEIQWTKPQHGSYKLDTDAAFHEDGTGAVWVVLRNNIGQVVAGAATPFFDVLNAAAAEALAIQRGIALIEDLGCTNVAIESDSLEIIGVYREEREVLSPYAAILADCFTWACRNDGISFHHCYREANPVAHQLAKFFL